MSPPSVKLPDYGNYVAGQQVPSLSGKRFVSINPTTGKEWGHFADSSGDDVDRAVRSAHTAYSDGPWSTLSPTRRGRLLMKWGEAIAAEADRIGRIETGQNGKLLAEMGTQARVVLDWLYYYGGLADKVEGAVIPLDRTSVLNYTLREPLGVVGVIVPWNSPTFITVEWVAPALAAGNTVVIKPSEVTSASAIELARLAESVGIPPGVINVVTGGKEAGEALVDHPLVARIAFTGSEAGGRAIAERAGRRLIPACLELGGKSPNIVFDDADVDHAEVGVLAGIFAAAGQTCVAGSRAYVHERIYDELTQRLVKRAGAIRIGDPLLAETQMGPLATKTQLTKAERMIEQACAEGAEVLHGGKRPKVEGFADGYFFEPTIVHKAGPGNHLIRNEVFGPVLAITPFKNEDEVVGLANDSPFGLAAGVWTRDIKRGHRMARRLQCGTVWLNTYRAVTFSSPFGGYKASGFGRQNGIETIYQFLQTKSVWCELGDQVQDPFVLRT